LRSGFVTSKGKPEGMDVSLRARDVNPPRLYQGDDEEQIPLLTASIHALLHVTDYVVAKDPPAITGVSVLNSSEVV
jgi:hypothetical protein